MDKGNLAPILLFTYKRLNTLQQTVAALQQNFLANQSDLFIFSDAAKNDSDKILVTEVRTYLKTISGFKSIHIIEADKNNGLATSIINGVTQVIKKYGKVIVLEDDLITSYNFLAFMNKSLEYYKNNPGIISISGYNMGVKEKKNINYPYDIFFAKRAASWGWATWSKKWDNIDWNIVDFKIFSKDKIKIKAFNEWGSDMFSMLRKQQLKKNDSWAIRYCYHQFKNNMFCVYPLNSKVRNIGFDIHATHTTQKYNRFDVSLDNSDNLDFNFTNKIILNDKIFKQFKALNGIRQRIFF